MNIDLLIIILLAISTLALVFAKTHVAFVTLALTAGSVMATNIAPGLAEFFNADETDNVWPFSAINLVLLLFAPLLIGYRFRRSQKGSGRFLQQLIPAFALSLLAVLFIFDALPSNAVGTLEDDSYLYTQLDVFRSWLIVFAIFTALFDVLMQHAGPPPGIS